MPDQIGSDATEFAVSSSRGDRDRTLQAVHRLESALAMAAEGDRWLPEVTADLLALESAMSRELTELDRPDALLSMIAEENPRRFGSRVRAIREQYSDILRQVASLHAQLDQTDLAVNDPGDLRHRTGWIIRALHNCRARQTDLVFDALKLDLGAR